MSFFPLLEIEIPGRPRQLVRVTDRTVFGRHEASPVELGLPGVSRTHFEIALSGSAWAVQDLKSRNGTLVNGIRLGEEPVPLKDGDELTFGPAKARVRLRSGEVSSTIVESQPSVALWQFPEAARVAPERLARDYDLLRAAHLLSHAIGETSDPDVLLAQVAAFCLEQLDADHVFVVDCPPTGDFAVRSARSRGVVPPPGPDLPLSRTVLRTLVETREALFVTNAPDAFAASQSVAALGLVSLLAVPLLEEGRVCGALVVDNRERQEAFQRRHLHLLTGIAAQASVALDRARLLRQVAREAETRGRLSRFLPPPVVDQIVDGRLSIEPGGRDGPIAVLYCDIRGFTTLTRELGPQRAMSMLNEYYELLVPIVFRHQGMVDKFVGDEVFAVWGVPLAHADDGHRALRCALEMQHALTALAARRSARGEPAFACGIGVNAGPATIGVMGAAGLLQFTVVGDTVNVGARLCSAAGAGEVATLAPVLHGWEGPAFPEGEAVTLKNVAGQQTLYRWRAATE